MPASMSVVKRTREAKLQAAAGALAIQMAKERNDPMYRKFKKFRDRFITMKKKIKAKYWPKAVVKARASLTGSKQ